MTSPGFVRSLYALAGLSALCLACGDDERLPPPPLEPQSPTGGSDTGDSPLPSTASGNGGGPPAHCVLDEGGDPDETGAEDTGVGSFKFDVGAPQGGNDFPVDCTEVEATRSNLGCEFWATDLPNDYRGTPMSPPASSQQFAVVVANPSALVAADVQVYVADEPTAVTQVSVEPGQTREIALDPLDIEPRFGTDDGQAYRIESSVPITAYQFNPLDNQVQVYSNDASLLLPTHALGQSYTAVTADAILLSMSPDDPEPVNSGAFVSVVATEDATTVEILPTAAVLEGPQTATIDRGQVLTVVSEAAGSGAGNLTGTLVVADAPVAVFSGNMATAIPAGGACCADHIEHQQPPHEAWGTAYALAPPPSPVADLDDPAVYRLIAAFDNTELRYCPQAPSGAPARLDAGQTVVFETDQAFTVESDPDRPFSVTQFLQSFQALSKAQPGDPAMIATPSVGQFQRRTLVAVPAGYAVDFALIVTRGEGEVRIDGEPIPAEDFAPMGVARNSTHAFVQVPLAPGAHEIEADVPFGVTVVGFDEAVSYGYPGAAGLRVIAVPPAAG
ncbi:MAG: IgGFc-binding protein [Myxococcota bacterium]